MTKLPDGWSYESINSIVAGGMIADGDWVESKDQDSNGQVRLTQLADVGEGEFRSRSDRWMNDEQASRLNVNYLQAGDLLMARMPEPLGRTCMVPENIGRAVTVVDVAIIRITRKDVNPKFVMWLLNSPGIRQQIEMLASGTTRQRITRKNLGTIDLPMPPFEEQCKIVELLEDHLSRLNAALADVKQAKVKATKFRRSLLQAAFTGNLSGDGTHLLTQLPNGPEFKRLDDCLEKLKSGKKAERGWSPQCLSNPSPDENVWGVLKTTAVQMGQYEPEHNKELPASLEPKIGLEVNPGDFLVTTTGPRNRCGIVCHVRETRKKLIFSGKILRFRADETIVLSNWLLYLLMSPDYQIILDQMKVGTSDSSVSIGNQQILDLQIPVPPISEQQEIVENLEDHLSRLDASVAIADEMEKQTYSLRRSLLKAAFTGQLTKEVVSV